jgi:L-ascorbate metabolism protein UlaG (beta-lactamase superfamily)
MKFTWIGGPSFRLELGPYIIIGDPVHADEFELDGVKVRRTHVLQPVETNDADLVLVTSARADHCDVDAIAKCHTDQIFGPEGVPAVIPIVPGDSRTVTKHDVPLMISPVPAIDGATGFFLNLQNSERPFSAYITGDVLYSDQVRHLQHERGHANLLVIHLGAERKGGALRSADAKEAMQIVYRMQPNAIAAVHHTSFSHYTEALSAFAEKIDLTIYENRLRRLKEGESFEKNI